MPFAFLCLPSRSVLFRSVLFYSRSLSYNNNNIHSHTSSSSSYILPRHSIDMSSDKTTQIRAFGRPDPTTPQTTFVQADPSNFRTIVQKLTGAPELPLTLAPSPRPASSRPPPGTTSPVTAQPTSSKHGFKLHERRHRKLDTIQLGNSDHRQQQQHHQYFQHSRSPGHPATTRMVSPVSPLELFGRGCSIGSPRTSSVLSPKEEEEKAIAEKGFYLHPFSPLGGDPPELLSLFPLHSPKDQPDEDSTS